MTKELSSALSSEYQAFVPLINLAPTSTVDPDRDSNSQIYLQNPIDSAEAYEYNVFYDIPDNSIEKYSNVRTDDYLINSADLLDIFNEELAEKDKKAQEIYRAYYIRIETLRGYAMLDNFIINKSSETDFWSFIRSNLYIRKAGIVLMDNGNLRAVWKDDNGNFIGLQFLGNQSVEYVIFKRRSPIMNISRVAGRDTIEGIKKQIHAFDLTDLMNI